MVKLTLLHVARLDGESWSRIPYEPSQYVTAYVTVLYLTLPLRTECVPTTTVGLVSLVM